MKLVVAVSLGLAFSSLGACRGKPPLSTPEGYDTTSTFNGSATTSPRGPAAACRQLKSESLVARKATMLSAAGGATPTAPTKTTVTRAKLWQEFEGTCGTGSCHVAKPGSVPNPLAKSPAAYTLTEATFNQRQDLGSAGLTRIDSMNNDSVMPPGSIIPRKTDDPTRSLGQRLLAWEEAKFPDSFEVQNTEPVAGGNKGPQDAYAMTPEVADQLTNIGTCLPSAKLEKRMDEASTLDALFAGATSIDDLPETLAETDLVSLDSAVLAQRTVYSYAPTYTLFSDHASKMRYVRVPVGTKVTYNAENKDFVIPPNTRFYKTFLRKVFDKNGDVGYRKMETRLIVSRPDHKLADGRYEVRSLMVVYAWDKDERMARKVTDPTEGQKPWADRLCPYVEDERETRTQKANPVSADANKSGKCTYMTQEEVDNPASGKVRHYGIPSQDRCVQCHMGSNNHSFILGFMPWQVDRRKPGEGGTYEPAHEDELDQLQRLTEYGVIAGIEPGQAKLEESQGDRKPRNDYELTAQGYMMGNCAFCHNANGFPTVQNPILKDFELFPSSTGGTFQFPLEKFSPRAKVGPKQVLRFPYITPAFGDFTQTDTKSSEGVVKDNSKYLGLGGDLPRPTLDFLPPIGAPGDPNAYNDVDQNVEEYDPLTGDFNFVGPWRSLIWRNVATPFTYEEDSTIFIHMPRNVPGFDCRAKKIMAEWMLSIPSVPKLYQAEAKDPKDGSVVPGKNAFPPTTRKANVSGLEDGFEQPYVEVKPGDLPYANANPKEDTLPGQGVGYTYENAVRTAMKRLENYRNSLTGQDCPDDEDTVDPRVINGQGVTAPIDRGVLNGPRVNPAAQGSLYDKVPDHAHWVPVDNTTKPGAWIPRRSNWKEVLVDRTPAIEVKPKVKTVIDELGNFYLSPEREKFAKELIPLGLWHKDCRTSAVANKSLTVSQLRQEQGGVAKANYGWLSGVAPGTDNWPVHKQSRGQAVFNAICLNCHGKDIDSRSPLAATIIELSGGRTKVANFRDGIFGPVSAPGQYADFEFSRAGGGGTPADWEARYMIFMGLGGTEAVIPKIAINLVGTSPFYGAAAGTGQDARDANMLESASIMCENTVAAPWRLDHVAAGKILPVRLHAERFFFVEGTGHYELWAGLCRFQNVPLVNVFSVPEAPPSPGTKQVYPLFSREATVFRAKDSQGAWVYPTNHPVGTNAGTIERGISPSNSLPWCVSAGTTDQKEQALKNFRAEGIVKEEDMPFCPPSLLTKAFLKPVHKIYDPRDGLNPEALTSWSRTGAINIGATAYYFMDGVMKKTLMPEPAFDECPR